MTNMKTTYRAASASNWKSTSIAKQPCSPTSRKTQATFQCALWIVIAMTALPVCIAENGGANASATVMKKANNSDTVFRRAGTIHTTMASLQLRVVVDLEKPKERVKELSNLVMRQHSYAKTKQMAECLEPAALMMHDAHSQTKTWTNEFLKMSKHARTKRSLALIAGTVFGFLANSAISLFHLVAGNTNSPTLDHMSYRLNHLQKIITRHVFAMDKEVNEINRRIRCLELTTAVNQVAAHVDGITQAMLTTLHTAKISPTMLPPYRIMHYWPNITAIAASHNAQLPPAHAIYELPAHFEQDSKELTITVSIPLISATLELWSPVNFPLDMPSGPRWVHMLENQHLAIDPTTATFAIFDDADLSSCPKIGGHWFCHAPARYTRPDTSCAAALFHANSKAAAKICHTSPYRGGIRAIRTGQNNFNLFSPGTTSLSIACGTARRWTMKLPEGFSTITMKNGCTAMNANITFTVPPATDTFVDIVSTLDWTEEHEETMATSPFSSHQIDTSADWTPTIQQAVATMPATIGAGIFGALGLATCLWLRHKRTKAKRAIVTDADTMRTGTYTELATTT